MARTVKGRWCPRLRRTRQPHVQVRRCDRKGKRWSSTRRMCHSARFDYTLARAYNTCAEFSKCSPAASMPTRCSGEAIFRRRAQYRGRRQLDHSRHRTGGYGSKMDDVIFEEFKGTAIQKFIWIAEFPKNACSVDQYQSIGHSQGRAHHGSGRAVQDVDTAQAAAPMDELAAIEFLLDKMKDTKTNTTSSTMKR